MPEEALSAVCPLCGGFGGHGDDCPNRRKNTGKAVIEWDVPTDVPSMCEEPST